MDTEGKRRGDALAAIQEEERMCELMIETDIYCPGHTGILRHPLHTCQEMRGTVAPSQWRRKTTRLANVPSPQNSVRASPRNPNHSEPCPTLWQLSLGPLTIQQGPPTHARYITNSFPPTAMPMPCRGAYSPEPLGSPKGHVSLLRILHPSWP